MPKLYSQKVNIFHMSVRYCETARFSEIFTGALSSLRTQLTHCLICICVSIRINAGGKLHLLAGCHYEVICRC